MKRLERFLAVSLMAGVSLTTVAQDKVEGTLSADFVSSYIWRSQHNASVSIQPSLGLAYKGLSATAWGSFAVSPMDKYKGTQEEIDLTLAYSTGGFTIGVTDYYFFDCGHPYFKYGNTQTAHTFEANIGYDFGSVAVNWFTNFAGTDGVNTSGNRAYSSYLQLAAPFKLAGMDCTATVGAVPFTTDFYAADNSNGFHINQVALRAQYDLPLGNYSLPLFGQLIANPSSQEMFFVAGFTLHAF